VNGLPWIGFEISTPLRLAHERVASSLAAQGLAVVDEFDELALVDAAMDSALSGGGRLAALAEGSGLRQAIAASVRSLRLAGITASDVAAVRLRDLDKRNQIAGILAEYERRLEAESRIDAADVLRAALQSLDRADARAGATAAAAVMPDRIYLMPDLGTRGLAGQFLQALQARGAVVLPADPVFGMARPRGWLAVPDLPTAAAAHRDGAAPLSWLHDVGGWAAATQGAVEAEQAGAKPGQGTAKAGLAGAKTTQAGMSALQGRPAAGDVVLDVFAAASVSAEVREVLRRIMAAGLRWDEVEIIATDADVYGVALDGLGRRLGIAVSHAAGLPLARTRAGRAIAAYIEWVQLGYPADVLRQMLERGDIAPVDGSIPGIALARRLRSLRIGRGLDRHAAAIDGARASDGGRDDRGEMVALAALLRPLIDAAPRVSAPSPRTGNPVDDPSAPGAAWAEPGREPGGHGTVAPSDVARGLLVLLEHVPAGDAVERSAKTRVAARLQRLAGTVTRPTTLAGAIAAVSSRLEDRVPAPEGTGGSPWNAAGGHLHLTELESGGFTGRRATFVVGLDSSRFPGPGGSDALLVDDDRSRLAAGRAPAPLPTTAERIDERRFAFAALVARLRGAVTFSYAAWDAVEGRALAPASELLQVHRLVSGDNTADYEALHAAVSPPASAVPRGSALLDGADAWLHALAHDPDAGSTGALRRGVSAVCAAYPHLEAGVRAWKARKRSDVPTAYHGAIVPRPSLDPRSDDGPVVSAMGLQTLGACPHRYLLRHVLRVKVPGDPDLSPDVWLQPPDRGALLHALYERVLRTAAELDIDLDDDAFDRLVASTLEDEIAARRERLPPPGAAVFEAERSSLREDARAFIAMVRQDGRRFIELERRFGRDGSDPVEIALPDGSTIRLEGAIDRIDALEDGRLLVIDYKTGSNAAFGRDTGALDGGRRLQHVLYTAAAERLLGRDVAAAEYQFPTRRSENHRVRYDAASLRDGLGLVAELLDLVRNGWFLPSSDAADCGSCDYTAACRVRIDAWGGVTSPLAEWSREADGAAADLLRRLRR
jgi:ATP-dependent helicase/nuclease subunit B